jgi:hypothetical protein
MDFHDPLNWPSLEAYVEYRRDNLGETEEIIHNGDYALWQAIVSMVWTSAWAAHTRDLIDGLQNLCASDSDAVIARKVRKLLDAMNNRGVFADV